MPDNFDIRKEWIIAKTFIPSEIASFMDKTFLICEIRRKVGEVNGVRFEVRSREQNHSIPHVHASYGEYSVSIAIDDGRFLSGNLPKKHRKDACAWVLANRDKLLSEWSNFAVTATSTLTKSLLNTVFDKD